MVPDRLQRATFELALRAATETLLPDLQPSQTVVTKEKVGSLEVEYEVVDGVSLPVYASVLSLLRPLLRGRGGVEIVRS